MHHASKPCGDVATARAPLALTRKAMLPELGATRAAFHAQRSEGGLKEAALPDGHSGRAIQRGMHVASPRGAALQHAPVVGGGPGRPPSLPPPAPTHGLHPCVLEDVAVRGVEALDLLVLGGQAHGGSRHVDAVSPWLPAPSWPLRRPTRTPPPSHHLRTWLQHQWLPGPAPSCRLPRHRLWPQPTLAPLAPAPSPLPAAAHLELDQRRPVVTRRAVAARPRRRHAPTEATCVGELLGEGGAVHQQLLGHAAADDAAVR